MSKLVAFAAIQGAYNIVSKAEGTYKRALETYGGSQKIEFPNTAYFLPIIYSLTGIKVTDLDSAKKPLEFARKLLPPHIKKDCHLPYLGPLLDAGMAALFAEEIAEAIRYVEDPDFYQPEMEDPDVENGKIWLGAADDAIMRKRGVEFVDGTAPGFAAIVGSAPDSATAKKLRTSSNSRLRRMGVRFCLDNFGTGASSWTVTSYLQITTTDWHHVSVSYDGATGEVQHTCYDKEHGSGPLHQLCPVFEPGLPPWQKSRLRLLDPDRDLLGGVFGVLPDELTCRGIDDLHHRTCSLRGL